MMKCLSPPDTLEQERWEKRPTVRGLRKFITFIKDGARRRSCRQALQAEGSGEELKHRLPQELLLPDGDSVTEDDADRLLPRVPGSRPGRGQVFPRGDQLQTFPSRVTPASAPEI